MFAFGLMNLARVSHSLLQPHATGHPGGILPLRGRVVSRFVNLRRHIKRRWQLKIYARYWT